MMNAVELRTSAVNELRQEDDDQPRIVMKNSQFKRHTNADLLCCNRGFERRVFFEVDQCNCKFHYCCRVECEPCERRIERHFCL
ncbi:hypothetical protein COOONC_16661 [Cooperia oncophora]